MLLLTILLSLLAAPAPIDTYHLRRREASYLSSPLPDFVETRLYGRSESSITSLFPSELLDDSSSMDEADDVDDRTVETSTDVLKNPSSPIDRRAEELITSIEDDQESDDVRQWSCNPEESQCFGFPKGCVNMCKAGLSIRRADDSTTQFELYAKADIGRYLIPERYIALNITQSSGDWTVLLCSQGNVHKVLDDPMEHGRLVKETTVEGEKVVEEVATTHITCNYNFPVILNPNTDTYKIFTGKLGDLFNNFAPSGRVLYPFEEEFNGLKISATVKDSDFAEDEITKNKETAKSTDNEETKNKDVKKTEENKQDEVDRKKSKPVEKKKEINEDETGEALDDEGEDVVDHSITKLKPSATSTATSTTTHTTTTTKKTPKIVKKDKIEEPRVRSADDIESVEVSETRALDEEDVTDESDSPKTTKNPKTNKKITTTTQKSHDYVYDDDADSSASFALWMSLFVCALTLLV